ncbi:DUF5703 domain-containing protein [Negadavirga shengliensis]|uniref:DUF5703 domain-containing protein n=1 Tax=Negadavirga shengliensis TaxID=1389218 RepID=A0ABV9T504_9BACT
MLCTVFPVAVVAQDLAFYNPVWESPSQNASESLPLGGGDIGMNVWVEDGAVYFYFSRSGTFDEHNTLLKLGRVRLELDPNPFINPETFRQELLLRESTVKITGHNEGQKAEIEIWADVYQPIIHVEVDSDSPMELTAVYESWRHKDRPVKGKANQANSYKWAPQGEVIARADHIGFEENGVLFYHNNPEKTVFDVVAEQQQLDAVKDEMFNPLAYLKFGGWMGGTDMIPAGNTDGTYQDTDYKGWKIRSKQANTSQHLGIFLHTEQTQEIERWQDGLWPLINLEPDLVEKSKELSREWWRNFWDRSYLITDPSRTHANDSIWAAGRNYQLFRYMLGCNAYGTYPTKFNGGLFTVDPVYTDSTLRFTPDHRNWGGGTTTAMNQRLVHFPMLKTGDFEMLKPQFDFYLRLLKTAELRTKTYWDHEGAVFSEQLENFGLPNPAEYSWNRPEHFDPGVEYNAWLEYQWDTVLEFCLMMLEVDRYTGEDIRAYIPFVESCLRFFDEHYQYRARRRGTKSLDENGHLVIYPGTANETYKMAYNANTTISALKTITSRLLELPDGYLDGDQVKHWEGFLRRLPPLNLREIEGKTMLAPAKLWERVNNTETPQLYPVYPWGIYGLGRPGLDLALNTWYHDPDALKFRSHVGWKQDNIFAARLGLTEQAAAFTLKKLADSGRRFPAFWGPGFDWVPDHNWGGAGMIGLQEMLMQTHGRKILLFPAWPKDWDVRFRLHAPYQTIVEGELKGGSIKNLKITPGSRKDDVINLLGMDIDEKKKLRLDSKPSVEK